MGLLNKIYGLVQAGRCLFSIFCDDRLKQLEGDPRVFRKFDDGEVEMVIVVYYVDDVLAHAKDQAPMERFAAGLGGKFTVKSMVEKFGVEKASRASVSLGGQPLLKADEPQTPGEENKFPYREAVGALV